MVLDTTRNRMDPLLTILARPFRSLSPDILTAIALFFAVTAGAFFYLATPQNEPTKYLLLFAAFAVTLNGLFDAIDGKVAKLTHQQTARGDFLDHALDRYADVFIIGGLALNPLWCRPSIGLLAIIGVLLTSYMGTQAQAVGCKRDYSGLLGRADRIALLIAFPIIQHLFIITNATLPYDLTVLEIAMILFAVIGNITALQRFFGTLRWFNQQ
jgi:archaetidylinositol phosphate synthase